MWSELRNGHADENRAEEALTETDLNADGTIAGGGPTKTLRQAAWQIVIADVSMSLDNVSGGGGGGA